MIFELVVTNLKNNLRVMIDGSMQMLTQCSAAVKKVNFPAGIIRKTLKIRVPINSLFTNLQYGNKILKKNANHISRRTF